MSDERYQPVGEVLNGIEVLPLPEGCIATSAVVLLQALRPDGAIACFTRYSDGLTFVEIAGMLRIATVLNDHDVVSAVPGED